MGELATSLDLARYAEKAQMLAKQGVELAIADVFDADAVKAGAADAHVVTELERRLLETSDLEGIVLRYGFFYGHGTWFAPDGDVANQVRQQQFPIVGQGEGVWSWLHIEDAAIATVAAAEQGNPGIYLIADNQPLKVR